MKLMHVLQTWLLITVIALSANGVVNAKVASGHQNLSGGAHQSRTVLEALLHQGLEEVSTTNTSGSPLATKSVALGRQQTLRSFTGKTGGKSYYSWVREGLSTANPKNRAEFVQAFKQAIGNAKTINFNLDGLNLQRAYRSGARGPFDAPANVTNWEFRQVLHNPKTVFWQNGRVVPYETVLGRLGG